MGIGYDSFQFTVNDGIADSLVPSTLTIDVTAVNDLPTVQGVTASVGTATSVASGAVMTSNVGTATSLASGAVLTLNTDGSYEFVPGETLGVGETANEVINYTITDDQGATSTSTLTIAVTAVNDLPTAADKTVTATEDTAFVFAVGRLRF
jgi:hypothetical protein